jgi:hypothetical protein
MLSHLPPALSSAGSYGAEQTTSSPMPTVTVAEMDVSHGLCALWDCGGCLDGRALQPGEASLMGFFRERLIRAKSGALTGIRKPPATNSRLGPDFDAFLFEAVGEDRNGLPISVVSLLARMDLDPWKEAACLADLPAEAAAQKLALLLAASPTQTDCGSSAARLIALLPRRANFDGRSLEVVNAGASTHSGLVIMRALVFAIWLIWLFGVQTLIAPHAAPERADVAQTTAPLTTPSQATPATPGR